MVGMRNANSCGAGFGWEISQGASGLQFIGEGGTRNFGSTLAPGTWNHVGVTYGSGTLRLYLGGVEVANSAYTPLNHLLGALQFGHVGGCSAGGVVLNECKILSRELTPTELGTAGTIPAAPTGLMFTAINSQRMDLAWTPPPGSTYWWIIERGTASGNERFLTHAPPSPPPNPPPTFNSAHLTPNTQYSWQVRAVQNGLLSDPSNEIIGTTVDGPATPMNFTATAASQTRIDLTWTASPTATKYHLLISTMGAAGPFSSTGIVLAPMVARSITGLTANTQYWFEIQAEDSTMALSAVSSPPATATTLP